MPTKVDFPNNTLSMDTDCRYIEGAGTKMGYRTGIYAHATGSADFLEYVLARSRTDERSDIIIDFADGYADARAVPDQDEINREWDKPARACNKCDFFRICYENTANRRIKFKV